MNVLLLTIFLNFTKDLCEQCAPFQVQNSTETEQCFLPLVCFGSYIRWRRAKEYTCYKLLFTIYDMKIMLSIACECVFSVYMFVLETVP